MIRHYSESGLSAVCVCIVIPMKAEMMLHLAGFWASLVLLQTFSSPSAAEGYEENRLRGLLHTARGIDGKGSRDWGKLGYRQGELSRKGWDETNNRLRDPQNESEENLAASLRRNLDDQLIRDLKRVVQSAQIQQIENIKPGQTLTFPKTGHYVAMRVTSTKSSTMDAPINRVRQECLDCIYEWTADRVLNRGISTMCNHGPARMDAEGIYKEGAKTFAKVRVQSGKLTHAGVQIETSSRRNAEGPYFGQNRIRAGLRASLKTQANVKFEEI